LEEMQLNHYKHHRLRLATDKLLSNLIEDKKIMRFIPMLKQRVNLVKSGDIPLNQRISDLGNIQDYIKEKGPRWYCNERPCGSQEFKKRWGQYCINGTFVLEATKGG